MLYEVKTTSGHVLRFRGVDSIKLVCEDRRLDVKWPLRSFTVNGVTSFTAKEDPTPWLNTMEIDNPEDGGAPASVAAAEAEGAEDGGVYADGRIHLGAPSRKWKDGVGYPVMPRKIHGVGVVKTTVIPEIFRRESVVPRELMPSYIGKVKRLEPVH